MAEGNEPRPFYEQITFYNSLTGNVVDRIREAKAGITYWRNGNNATNTPVLWGLHILIKNPYADSNGNGGYFIFAITNDDIYFNYNAYDMPAVESTLVWRKLSATRV